ncbi:hypothetical protein SAMN04489761_2134 [Tenacibaculum sp. MAR_2009_124]|uniref:hypothetical protein n=1 Tax=Tenacibaculum sp. MAR_2009_124 TaxID=1250059 RepID=UPI0008973803|nr:hypothetical protein [Tenacibaculum sp. MAR_2009_124]SEB97302.1 hypothetical protein SAMN04489761_2134 [Tenacibaculum sp. MAR_2009_124]
MEMKRQLMIHNTLTEGETALKINSGTVHHSNQKAALVNYLEEKFIPEFVDDAYVTKRDWRSLTDKELKLLKFDENRTDFNTIYLGVIPENLKVCFQRLKLDESVNREEVFSKLGSNPEDVQQVTELLDQFLEPISNNKKFNFHCMGVNYPNVELVACNTTMLPDGYQQSDKKFLGIHNDGTQVMTIDTAHEFGNRISINLGKDSRYFLFVNLALKEAYAMLREKLSSEEIKQVSISNIPKYFFRHFSDYPVIRVEQKPYQYYIAPTDNCFHDGSTLGTQHLDVCIVYFGNFQY